MKKNLRLAFVITLVIHISQETTGLIGGQAWGGELSQSNKPYLKNFYANY